MTTIIRAGYAGMVAADTIRFVDPETALYDFAASFRSATEESLKAIEAVKLVPAPAVAPKSIETKPKPKPQQVEEEEGC